MLARRELSVAECRSRLARKEHSEGEIDAAVARLIEAGALDDRRVADAFARTAINVRGRGRLRIQRELQAKGIDHVWRPTRCRRRSATPTSRRW